ncbi:MAG TPA: DEAD/DEAH box helicase [Rhodanobacter sp.]|nr:DEAD/DEAH box helicase [Rhodanobacter sp.]
MNYDVGRSWAEEPLFYRAPHPPSTAPMEFQFAGAEYVIERNHALIGDDPGLGKSCEGILVSNAIRANRTLVVCPASLLINWQREIWNWSTVLNVTTSMVFKSTDGVSNTADYVILSWAMLTNPSILAAILDLRWDHVILDEAHAMKDPRGNNRTKVVCAEDRLPSVTGRFTALSGTILPNQPRECYNAIRLLNWSAINKASLEDFVEYYYDLGGGMVRGMTFDTEAQVWARKLHYSNKVRNVPRNLDDLQFRLRKNLMVRRRKVDVLKQLPLKTWHPFPLVLTSAIRQALKHPGFAQASKLYELDPAAFDRGVPIDGAIATARKELGLAKAPSVATYIDDLMEGGVTKLVVSAWHHAVLDYLRGRLERYGLVYMDGRTSVSRKQNAVDRFQSDDRVKIILGQMLPLGEGWTLTAAQDAVLAEFDWVPGKNDQLLDRINRMGQTGARTIGHIPVCPGTLDERVLATAIDKAINIHAALDKH